MRVKKMLLFLLAMVYILVLVVGTIGLIDVFIILRPAVYYLPLIMFEFFLPGMTFFMYLAKRDKERNTPGVAA